GEALRNSRAIAPRPCRQWNGGGGAVGCPLWVKSGKLRVSKCCPLHPRKRTSCSPRKPRLGGRRSGRICDGLVCCSGVGRATHCSAEVAVFGRSAATGTT